MVDQVHFLLEALTQVHNNTSKQPMIFYHPQLVHVFFYLNNSLGNKCFNFKIPSWSVYPIIPFSTHFPTRYLKFIKGMAYNSTSFPNLSIIFPGFLLNVLYTTWTTPSFYCRYLSMCVHSSHRPYGFPPFTLCSWQQTHGNP
jgi:hypothetical protein